MQTQNIPQTFFHLPLQENNPQSAQFLFIPVPYEGTVCFLKGTSQGPDSILEVSNQVENFDEETHSCLSHHVTSQYNIATLPHIEPADSPEEEYQRIYKTVKEQKLFCPERFPIFLGGEHSITPPLVQAAVEEYPNVSVLQFDAHADLRNSYTGGKYSHASAMRRVLEHTPHLVQTGIRSYSAEEYKECPDRINAIIAPQQIRKDLAGSIERIIDGLTETVYITFDIDAFDPAFAPGTGTPEPGGLDWFQVCTILREVFRNKAVIGADIVEVMPLKNNNVITEFLAARLAGKIIAYKQEH